MSVTSFLSEAQRWTEQDENIRCMVLVGSQARGTARADSDVDLVVMAEDPRVFIRDHSFAGRFGSIDKMETEDWGKVTSVRVFYKDGLEVEFCFTDPSWCSVPLDAGTLEVLRDGYRIMTDKENYFSLIDIDSDGNAAGKNGGTPELANQTEKSAESDPEPANQAEKQAEGDPEPKGRKNTGRRKIPGDTAPRKTGGRGKIAYRSEKEMLELILDTARNDERIRAVVMNGSRTNPDAPKDRYQDYDVVYVVSELKPFVQDHSWIDIFGERIILQMPEAMDLLPPCNDGSFNYQMLFADGNRIDLVLLPVDKAGELLGKDSLTENLLDKDGILPPAGEPDDSSYHIKPPTDKLYSDCCNEFWWVLQNVAKGICRDELPYAMRMSEYARDMLDQMLCWHIGGMNGFKVSAGKCGRYFKRYLSELQYKMYADTYSNAEYDKLWKAVFTMCGLFRETAKAVAERSGFVYNEQEDRGMSAYLKEMKGHKRR